MARLEPIAKHRFGVEIDGIVVARFAAVTGISAEAEVTEYQEGGRNEALLKLPGQGRLGVLGLRRGYAGEPVLWQWARDALTGRVERRGVDVIVLRDSGEEVGRYTLRRAWPVKWEAQDFDASGSDRQIEVLELAYEGLTYTASSGGAGAASGGGGPAAARRMESRLDEARQTAAGGGRAGGPGAPGGGGGLMSELGDAARMARQAYDAYEMVSGAAEVTPAAVLDQAAGVLDAAWQDRLDEAADPEQVEAAARVREGMDEASDWARTAESGGVDDVAGEAAEDAVGRAFDAAAEDTAQVPAPLRGKAESGAKAFARSGAEKAASAASGDGWSDGPAPVQPAAGFDEPPLSPDPSFSLR